MRWNVVFGMLFPPASGQIAPRKVSDDPRLRDDKAVHGRCGYTPECGDRIPVEVIADAQGLPLAVQEALAAALAVLRVGDDGLMGLTVEIEYIHRADVHTVLTADAFVEIDTDHTHISPSFCPKASG